MESIIHQVFIKVGSAEKDHPWYECPVNGGKVHEMVSAPTAFPAPGILHVTVPRDTAVVMYRRWEAGRLLWGVSWGRTPLDLETSQDRLGRFMQFRLLVEFQDAEHAVLFCAGVLDEWWPHRAMGITELGLKARQAIKSQENIVPAYIVRCLQQWKEKAPQTLLSGAVTANEALHSRLSVEDSKQKELRELRDYLLSENGGFLKSASAWLGSLPREDDIQHAVVVTTSVVVSRLVGVWRAMTDLAVGDGWHAYPAPKPIPRPVFNSPDPPEAPVSFIQGVVAFPGEMCSAAWRTFTGFFGKEDSKPRRKPRDRM
jgi:hypothetical protein